MGWIDLEVSRRGDADAFDEGKALGEEATFGIFRVKLVIPTAWFLHSGTTSLGSQPLREVIAPCVHVGASAAATIEVEHERAAASLVHVMTIPRVQDVSPWIKLSIHSPTVCNSKTVRGQLVL